MNEWYSLDLKKADPSKAKKTPVEEVTKSEVNRGDVQVTTDDPLPTTTSDIAPTKSSITQVNPQTLKVLPSLRQQQTSPATVPGGRSGGHG